MLASVLRRPGDTLRTRRILNTVDCFEQVMRDDPNLRQRLVSSPLQDTTPPTNTPLEAKDCSLRTMHASTPQQLNRAHTKVVHLQFQYDELQSKYNSLISKFKEIKEMIETNIDHDAPLCCFAAICCEQRSLISTLRGTQNTSLPQGFHVAWESLDDKYSRILDRGIAASRRTVDPAAVEISQVSEAAPDISEAEHHDDTKIEWLLSGETSSSPLISRHPIDVMGIADQRN